MPRGEADEQIAMDRGEHSESEGAKVHICDVDLKNLAALADTNPEITSSRADVSSREQVGKLVRRSA
jgi:short-subunit dehydrogenase involved in D-alanine esterification of teichoic acids